MAVELEEFGPFDPNRGADLYRELQEWCDMPDLTVELDAVDVCEVILPAIGALLDLYRDREAQR